MKNPQQLLDSYRSIEQAFTVTMRMVGDNLPGSADEIKQLTRTMSDIGDVLIAFLESNPKTDADVTDEVDQAVTDLWTVAEALKFYVAEIRAERKLS